MFHPHVPKVTREQRFSSSIKNVLNQERKITAEHQFYSSFVKLDELRK